MGGSLAVVIACFNDGGMLDEAVASAERQDVPAEIIVVDFEQSGNGYFVEMATRPQTIGYALLDSPVALAAWMLDHDTDAYYKIARAFVDGQPSGNLTRDNVLDNVTAYWLTGTGASAARSYWPTGRTRRPRAASLCRRRRSRSASRRSPARSGELRAAGSRRAIRTSSISTRSTRAATSLPGRSRSCSRQSSAPRSAHCADRRRRAARTNRCAPPAACLRRRRSVCVDAAAYARAGSGAAAGPPC
jgi:hypothetical protein